MSASAQQEPRERIGWSRGVAGIVGGLPPALGLGLIIARWGTLGLVLGALAIIPLWVAAMMAAWIAPKPWQAWAGVGLATLVAACGWGVFRL